MTRYRALALQTGCHAINGLSARHARSRIGEAIDRIGRQIEATCRFVGPDLRLVVLPEYVLTSYPVGEDFGTWIEAACLDPAGPEYAALADIARHQQIYLAVNAYETDPAFEGLYFQACVILSDDGEVVLRYRRLISMFAPTPHDVWREYLEAYGEAAVFPVAQTPLGRLACIASEEILYPEVARALALRGAEVLLHSTSEVGSPALTPKEIGRRARAVENQAVVVSANTAGIHDHPFPANSTDGMSKVIDWEGRVLAEAGFGESMVAQAEIDLTGLRAARRRPGMGNLLARQRLELFRSTYAGSIHPPDTLAADKSGTRAGREIFRRTQQRVIEQLLANGLLTGDDDD